LSALFKGYLYFDGEGNLLNSATGAVVTIDYQVPAGNQDQCDMLGDGSIIDAKWSAVGTDIHTHIQAILKAALKLTGLPLTTAYYGTNILDYLLKNTILSELIVRNVGTQQAFINGQIPDGFLGIQKWVPAQNAYYVDADNSYQDLMDDDDVVFTPTVSPIWYEFIEGSYPVPTNIGAVAADAVGAMSNILQKYGMFSYATVLNDPVTVKQNAGDTFLPVVKNPNAIVKASVHWT